VKPYTVPNVRAYAPRFGGPSLFFLSSLGGGDGLWRYENGQVTEIWRGADGAIFEPAAVCPTDGKGAYRVAIVVRRQGRRTLNTLTTDGGDVRPLAPAIDVTSAVCCSPDGKLIAASGIDSKGPGLFTISLESGEARRVIAGEARNPVWSPDGSVIVYTGPVVGATGPMLMVHPDGTAIKAPGIDLLVSTERYRFVPGRQQLVYVPSPTQGAPEHFWLLDLGTNRSRQMGSFDARRTRTFDVTADGQIVFDQLRENSDIVVIDLAPKRQK
jgi:hypothetical protein